MNLFYVFGVAVFMIAAFVAGGLYVVTSLLKMMRMDFK